MSSSGTTTSASGTVHAGMRQRYACSPARWAHEMLGAMTTLAGMPVLVTGAGGFIGSHLVERLVREGASVRALCRYNSRNERGTLDWIDQRVVREVDVVLGDLRDVESVDRATAGVEIVLHLAAQIAIPYSYVNARD